MRTIILFIFIQISSNNIWAIPIDTDFESALCSNILGAVPKQTAVSVTPGSGILGWYDDYHWESNVMNCSLVPEDYNYDSFTIKIFVDRYVLTKPGPSFVTKIDSTVKCLFTSNYEWECLYQESNFESGYTHYYLQFNYGEWIELDQKVLLDNAKNVTDEYL